MGKQQTFTHTNTYKYTNTYMLAGLRQDTGAVTMLLTVLLGVAKSHLMMETSVLLTCTIT